VATSFWIIKGTSKTLKVNLIDDAGLAIDLTGATTRLQVAPSLGSATLILEKTMVLDGAATSGKVRYDFVAADTPASLKAGDYQAQIVSTYGDGTVWKTLPFVFSIRSGVKA